MVLAPTRATEHAPGVVAVPFVLSRIWSDLLLVVVGRRHSANGFLAGFDRWDGRWYSWIAAHGYVALPHAQHHQTPWPFFPLFPVVTRIVSSSGLSVQLAGIVVNHVAFFAALVAVFASRRVTRPARGMDYAVWVSAVVRSVVFSMAYPSAIFLAASAWAFLWAERGQDLPAGLAAGAAALVRPDGLIVALILVWTNRCDLRRTVALAVPAVIALGAWVLFNLQRTEDALRFFHAKKAWHEVTLPTLLGHPTPNAVLHLFVAALAAGLVVAADAYPAVLVVVHWLVPDTVPRVGSHRHSTLATDCFPPAVAAGALLERRSRLATVAVVTGLAFGEGRVGDVLHRPRLPDMKSEASLQLPRSRVSASSETAATTGTSSRPLV